LGLSPSTYDYYEVDRVPPADILVRIADQAGVDLRWLVTGESPSADGHPPCEHPLVSRVARRVQEEPKSAEAIGAFMDLLDHSRTWQDGSGGQADAPPPAEPAPPTWKPDRRQASGQSAGEAASPAESPGSGHSDGLIPILGRSAAGVAHFWADPEEAREVTNLAELITRHADRAAWQKPGVLDSPEADAGPVQVIALPHPQQDQPAEFVRTDQVRRQYPDAFAVRIDGESMTPEIAHGDVILASPSAPAIDGQAAIVQLKGQIGVTCKVFRREGQTVHLIPINEQFEPVTTSQDRVQWALRVIGRVRAMATI
jgi:hypothetical protein